MAKLMWLAVLSAVLVITSADFPIDADIEVDFEHKVELRNTVDDTYYRLPEGLDATHVELEITPYFNATTTREAFTFDGIATMNVTVTQAGLTELTFQENVRQILTVTVTDANGSPVQINPALPFERQRNFHFLKIYIREGQTLVLGQVYTIRISYIGNINETPLTRGMFRGSYVGADGLRHWYAATHLQPTHSRQLLPSLDEPGFKSIFTIIVNRPAHFGQTYSNMRIAQEIPNGDRVREIFYPTPKMSAYLISIHISEAFTVIADNNDTARPYRILARPNAVGQGEYALEVGPPLTTWLDNYLGVPYYAMGEDMKNDQIAVPDWASGATENWGLVSYRELRLLYQEGETNAIDRMSIATITAHELAHKWFGNLVTARWWNNVWINEGYASYFEYFAMDEVDRTLELEDQFNIMYVQSAMSADASAATRALQHAVNSPTQVTGHFSGISYSKGASLLMMLRHFLTDATFRKSLNYFLVEMAYDYANPADVYRGFARAVAEDQVLAAFPNINITEFVRYWVEEPGFPVVTVDVNANGVMNLQQERFFLSPTQAQTDQIWPIPLTFTTQSDPNWQNLRATYVMDSRTTQITKPAGNEWVIFNIKQNGIYRVNYNEQNWNLLADALATNVESIDKMNRAQIVDDVFALMRSGRITYNLGFRILRFLQQDTSYYSWYPAITGFTWLRNRFLHMPEELAEFEDIIHSFMQASIDDLGYDVIPGEALSRTLHRFYLLNFACVTNHQGCIDDAVTKFNALVNNNVPVNPNIRRHVFCFGIKAGGYSAYQFMYNRWLAGNNPGDFIVMLRSMGCTVDPQAINEYLNLIISDAVRAQDRSNGFTFLFMGDRYNARSALPFFRERINDIRTAMIGTINTVINNLAGYMDEVGLVEMEAWLNSEPTLPEYAAGMAAINAARANMAWGTERAEEVLGAARGAAFTTTPAALLLIAAALLTLLKQ